MIETRKYMPVTTPLKAIHNQVTINMYGKELKSTIYVSESIESTAKTLNHSKNINSPYSMYMLSKH